MSVTYLDAIRSAQEKALRDDPRVFIYGQDVGRFGGAFKATKNLAEKFPGRVMDSPISEDAMVGMAVGAAMEGMRPIVEMQFADFSTVGLNQMLNHAATTFGVQASRVRWCCVCRREVRREVGLFIVNRWRRSTPTIQEL